MKKLQKQAYEIAKSRGQWENQSIEKVLPTHVAIKTRKFLNKALKTKKIQIFEYFLEMNNKKDGLRQECLLLKKMKLSLL